MTISLSDAGKRFNRDWIFRHFNFTFESGISYAITGPNGSGKSTLLQVLSGAMMISEGKCVWAMPNGKYEPGSREYQTSQQEPAITAENIYRQVSIAAPYLEIVEEMTLKEFLTFHKAFKPFFPGITIEEIIATVDLRNAGDKQIRFYSSGMKQRVKLAQCIFSDSAIVLLDEPCTNLDTAGIKLYHHLINEYCKERLVVVSSNDEAEFSFCNKKIDITDYK